MLLEVDLTAKSAIRVRGERLASFGLDERALQGILFRSLDRLLPDDELLVIMQSRHWQEEPDILALDSKANMYIFELKAWESDPKNLLQALRYGQIFGPYKYDDLARLYQQTTNDNRSLKDVHRAKFELDVPLDEEKFNAEQVFVVMTNGLDVKTREAIQYWRSRKLDVRPWVYRLYKTHDKQKGMLLELMPFRVRDNPYEDVAEGYYILNTNYSNDPDDDKNMLERRKAAAFSDPWKYKIERLAKGDIVFLYRSGTGIVAMGEATGDLKKGPHKGDPTHRDDEYSMKLSHFQLVDPPLSAAEIKAITATNHRFLGTMFGVEADEGKKLYRHILRQVGGASTS